MANLLNQLIKPEDVRNALNATGAYSQNRDRAGAVLHDGFAAYDAYLSVRPLLFAVALAGMVGSGYGFWKRGKRGVETKLFYAATFAASAAAAYVTRGAVTGDAPPDTAAVGPAQDSAIVRYIDGRAATLRAEDPNFANEAIGRLVQTPMFSGMWNSADPLVRAAIL